MPSGGWGWPGVPHAQGNVVLKLNSWPRFRPGGRPPNVSPAPWIPGRGDPDLPDKGSLWGVMGDLSWDRVDRFPEKDEPRKQ